MKPKHLKRRMIEFVYKICRWIDAHKSFSVVCLVICGQGLRGYPVAINKVAAG